MKVSDKGKLEICEHEGIVPGPYYDSVGVLTCYVGHTKNAGGINPASLPKGMPEDVDAAIDRAIEVFTLDLQKYEDRVNRAIKVPLKQHEFDALVSFDLNTGGIFKAKLTQAINAGHPGASQHFLGWLRPPEIRKRRMAEKRLFETGDYDHNGDEIAVWKVNAKGKLLGIHDVVSGAEILRRVRKTEAHYQQPAPTFTFLEAIIDFLKGLIR